jgi:hypothetical protein
MKIRQLYWTSFWKFYGTYHRAFALGAARRVADLYLENQNAFSDSEELEAFRAIIVRGYYDYFVTRRPTKLFPAMRNVISEIRERKQFFKDNLGDLSPWF